MFHALFDYIFECDSENGKVQKCRKVYFAALASLLLAVATGLVIGFPATALVDMDREDSPIRPSKETKTWIASVTDIGEIIGCLLAVPISETFGRRNGLIITTIPFIVGWICIIESKTVALIIGGRIITGICSGLSMSIAPTYLVEISSPDIRGLLGASFQTVYVFGILLSNIVGWFLPWNKLAICSCMIPVIAFCVLCFMPESPRWLVSKGHPEMALRVIQFLHGSLLDPVKEVSAIEEDLKKQTEKDSFRLSDTKKAIFWKPTALSLMLMFYKEVSGVGIFQYFTVEVFKSAKTTIDSNLSAIIFSTIQTISTAVSALIMDKVGRRILLTISAIGMFISLSCFGTFFFLQEQDITIANNVFNYLPLISSLGFIASYSIGYGPIPWMMMNELSPLKARSAICGVATLFHSSLAFTVTKTFINLQTALKNSGSFWLYAGCSLTSVVFVWCCLPETKGKPLEDILDTFKKTPLKKTDNDKIGYGTNM